jgi:hypothetical protein
MTPLHEAAWCGNEYAVRLFLSREAKLEMIDGVRTVRHRDGNSSRGGGVGGGGEGLDGLGWVDGWVWDGGSSSSGGGGGSVARGGDQPPVGVDSQLRHDALGTCRSTVPRPPPWWMPTLV